MKKSNELRAYHFGNMYLSSIQQGIQSAHAQMELFLKYVPADHNRGRGNFTSERYSQVYDWASNHKTMICLNAGYSSALQELKILLESEENPFPWSYFCESEEALQGVLTNICVILPERIYGRKERLQKGETILLGNNEYTNDIKMIDYFIYKNVEPASEAIYTFSKFENELYNFVSKCGMAR